MIENNRKLILTARRCGKTEAARQSGALFIGIDPGKPDGDTAVLFFYDDQGNAVRFAVSNSHKTHTEDFRRMYLGNFAPIEKPLADLAAEYMRRTEEFDRTVCTGPIGRDGIMPATPREMGLINRYAHAVRRDLIAQAEHLGFTEKQFNDALKEHARSSR